MQFRNSSKVSWGSSGNEHTDDRQDRRAGAGSDEDREAEIASVRGDGFGMSYFTPISNDPAIQPPRNFTCLFKSPPWPLTPLRLGFTERQCTPFWLVSRCCVDTVGGLHVNQCGCYA
ncbi:hypothetical protein TRVL_02820 [Trypanosoma vivax]|nr:hypothetical protein TRVL_02820 [Trypanosoma vivax]